MQEFAIQAEEALDVEKGSLIQEAVQGLSQYELSTYALGAEPRQ